jgi:protein TonB
MYFDLDDHRPETPRVPQAFSVREGIMLSIIVHLVAALFVRFGPFDLATAASAVTPVLREPVRYVQITPRRDRVGPPRLEADQSDLDRRAATQLRPPDAQNAAPFFKGDTPEKTEGAREERPVGPDSPASSSTAPTTTPPETPPEGVTPIPVPSSRPQAGGGLGQSLRDLRQYLQDQNFNNPRGGQSPIDPDIQFDSKGVEFGPWLRRFVAQVKRNWFVPQAAMLMRGRVVIQFYVLKNGAITELRIVQTSGIPAFDQSSFSALRLSNPTMPLPAEYPDDRAFFTVTFHYNEGRP